MYAFPAAFRIVTSQGASKLPSTFDRLAPRLRLDGLKIRSACGSAGGPAGGPPAPPWATAAALGPGGEGGKGGGDRLWWGRIRILHKAPTDYTKPQKDYTKTKN